MMSTVGTACTVLFGLWVVLWFWEFALAKPERRKQILKEFGLVIWALIAFTIVWWLL